MSTDLTLPYTFDTRQPARISLLALWSAVPLLIVTYILMESLAELDDLSLMMLRAVLPVVAIADVMAGFFLFRLARGATGSISTHIIEVAPDRFIGLHSGAPEGTFTIQHFTNVALRRTSLKGMKLGHVSLTGKDKAHSIKLGSLPEDKAEALAAFLARELKLPRDNS